MTEKKEELLPVINDEELRTLNTKKIVDSVESIGTHFEELKKQNRINFIIGGISSIIILVFLGAIVYSAFTVKGTTFLDNIVDQDLMAQRYTCNYKNETAIFRNPTATKDFLTIYPEANCKYKDIRGK